MQIRTFKEKFKEQYFRNRNLEGGVSLYTKDDLTKLIGTLCIFKVPSCDIDSIYNLDSLCYIKDIVKDKDGHITELLIKSLFIEEDITVFEVSFRQILLVTGDIVSSSWFMDGFERKFGCRPNKKRVISLLNSQLDLPIKTKIVERVQHIILIELYNGLIDSLSAKEVEIKTNRNDLRVNFKIPYHRDKEFRITTLTPKDNRLTNFLFKDIVYDLHYKESEEEISISSKHFPE